MKILFDLDGTLTDSGEGIMNCFDITLRHFGLPVPSREAMRVIVGPPLRDSFLRFGLAEHQLEEAIAVYRDNYNKTGRFENFPYPGIADVLSSLQAAGHRLYVATSKPETMSVEILTHFDLARYFDIICGATSDSKRNTKAAVIAHLLSQLEETEDIVMVGDTIYDVDGAKAHKIPCIAVTWGYGRPEEMEAAGAVLVSSTQALLSEIERR